MRLSILTPVVTLTSGNSESWEASGTIADVAAVARAADALGFHHLTCSEHLAIPASEADRRGTRYWDPLATFGYLAAVTERIRLFTNVLVLGYHHPLAIAKRYGTLDVVSGGRLVLGVGVGTLREEFDLLGAPYADRGARADDALAALRASLSQREPAYDGAYYRFGGMVVDPCAVQDPVPIWVGGRTLRSLRRAVRLADGWCPFAVDPAQVADWLAQVDVPDQFEVSLQTERRLDPVGRPDESRAALETLRAAGATNVTVRLAHRSLAHCLEQVHALAELQLPG